MSSKTYGILFCCFAILSCSSATYAAIIDGSTYVSVSATIKNPMTQSIAWTATDQGNKFEAGVDSGTSVATASADASISVNIGSPELATVNFDRDLQRTSSSVYAVYQTSETNWRYFAVTDSTATFSWELIYDFPLTYASGSVFEGAPVTLSAQVWDGSAWSNYRSFSMGPTDWDQSDGTYSGDGTFDLWEGNTYRIGLKNTPQLTTKNTYSYLDGYVSLNFNGAPVPIPSALWLLGSALIGLVGFRRKFTKPRSYKSIEKELFITGS